MQNFEGDVFDDFYWMVKIKTVNFFVGSRAGRYQKNDDGTVLI